MISAGFAIESTVWLLLALLLGRVMRRPAQRASLWFIALAVMPMLWLADVLGLGWQPLVEHVVLTERLVNTATPIPRSPWSLLAVAYAAVVAWRLMRWTRAQILVRRIAREARDCRRARWQRLSAQTAARMLTKVATVRVHASIGTPCLIGTRNPVICIPAYLQDCAVSEARQILLHEYAHLRARDGWRLGIIDVVSCLLWLHPLVQALRRRFRRDIELACDEAVLGAGSDAHAYASLLADCVRHHHRHGAAALGMALHRSDLVLRVAHILQPGPRVVAARRSWAFAVLIGVGALLSALNLSPRVLVDALPVADIAAPADAAQPPAPAVTRVAPSQSVADAAVRSDHERGAPPSQPMASARAAPSDSVASSSMPYDESNTGGNDSVALWGAIGSAAAEQVQHDPAQPLSIAAAETSIGQAFEAGLRKGETARAEHRARVMRRVWPFFGRVPL